MSNDQRKKEDILKRIKTIENALVKDHEYLETGAHADWRGFRQFFRQKTVEGKVVPPHRDWVRNLYNTSRQRALNKAEKLLDRFE